MSLGVSLVLFAGPKFFNVRPHSLQNEEEEDEGDDVVDPGIDGEVRHNSDCCSYISHSFLVVNQACKIVLKLAGSAKGKKGYNELCRAIVVLMSCGVNHSGQIGDPHGRVLVSGEGCEGKKVVLDSGWGCKK